MSERDEIRATYDRYDATNRSRLWDLRNPGYARLSSDRDRRVVTLVGRSSSGADSQLLDVGCGDGYLARLLEDRRVAAVYTGVDLLDDRIEAAVAITPGATFLVAGADAMPFEPGVFDVATAITLFSSIPSAEMERAVAREIGRVLRPGGWLVWYDMRYSNPTNPDVHGVSAQHLADLFPGWMAELRTTTLLPPVARRLGRLTGLAYPALQAIPPLRSHLIGRLQCPS